jgi:RNA polymerase sigma factor (sigma-70 family)
MNMPTTTLALGNLPAWVYGLASLSSKSATSAPIDPSPVSTTKDSAPFEMDLDDAAWIARVQAGDEDAARALVQRLYPTVMKSVRCHLPRRTSENDLAQAVFAKIFRKLDQFSGLVQLEHWVSRIAINTCIDQLKYELARPELRFEDLTEEQQAVVQHLTSTRDDLPCERNEAARELLERLLTRLSADERLVITLLHLEERSTKEISRLTGWSVSHVKVKAFRARRKMREVWNTVFEGEKL